MTLRFKLSLLAAPLALAACNKDAPEQVNQAPGEVLEGTISDAMLQTDQLQSEPEMVAPLATDGAQGGEDGPATARDAAPAAAEPAASPTPEAAPAPASTATPE